MPTALPDLRLQSLAELRTYLASIGEKPFRATQLYHWLWGKNAASLEHMTDLGKVLRNRLQNDFQFNTTTLAQEQQSQDGSIKYAFKLVDGKLVEGVLIPSGHGVTACVSSQVGCSLSCKFCATGYLALERNLLSYEIYDQVWLLQQAAQQKLGKPLTHVVYMGMGEPLLNYRNVLDSIEKVTSPAGMGMGARRITLSTAGIAKMIHRLGDEGFKSEFALSLHAATDAKRSEIMPINESNSIAALVAALQYFYAKTHTRITLEYILFQDFNDSLTDAEELAVLAHQVPSKINIIEYNPIGEATYRFTTAERLARFQAHLQRRGHIVNVRRSRGRDIDGACGQLALKQQPLPTQ